MFFTERIKEWLRPRPPVPKEEAEVLSAKVEIGEDGTTGMIHAYILTSLHVPVESFTLE